jgi:hypothetical protein
MYISDPLKRVSNGIYPYDTICSQALSTGFIVSDDIMKQLVLYFFEEAIRINDTFLMKHKHEIDFIFGLDESKVDDAIDEFIKSLAKEMSFDIIFLKTYCQMNKIMKEIIASYGSYGKFIKSLDNNYGLLESEIAEKVFGMISVQNDSLEELCNLIGTEYNRYAAFMFVTQGLKQNKNKNRVNAINNNDYVDSQKQIITLGIIKSKYTSASSGLTIVQHATHAL